jgi:twinkle protein
VSDESHFTHKEPCPACGSRDNLARYTDGHGFCFGCDHYEPATDGSHQPNRRRPTVAENFDPLMGEVQGLRSRGISEETCRHFGYTVGIRNGKKVHIAPYYKGGELVAQHYRDADKNFAWAGDSKGMAMELFGQHLWRDGGKKVVITEGEIDAMSVSQLQGNKWPVVSIPSGTSSAQKAIRANIEWLEKFDEVIIMFDMDEPGREAVAEVAPLFSPGKCKVASLPLKDANDMLKAGRGSEVIESMWGAKPYRPDGIRSVDDIADEAEADPEMGLPWWLDVLTELTYGRREGECYAFGAGTGIGKTDWFTQSIAYDVLHLGLGVGVLYLEQPNVETLRRIAGKVDGKIMHVPGKATREERRAAIAKLKATGRLHFYDSFGCTQWEVVKAKIRYMAVGLGCKSIYLDHLTALVAGEEDERKALDLIMAELAALALELKIMLHFISHLTRPKDGPPHEEGGRVKQAQFRGSNAIGMWAHFMFGLERNTQGEEAADRITTFRVLKDRNTGQATGKTILLDYDPETGLLFQTTAVPETSLFRDRSASTTNEEF